MNLSKVIAYSLWGNNPKYTIGAIENAKLALEIYPEWMCYFYIGKDVESSITSKLLEYPNTKIINKELDCDWTGMFWRFEAGYESDICIFRDTDSRLSLREKYAVDDWINSDKTVHIMRDHPYHGFPILGGMWGFKNNHKYDLKNMLDNFNKTNEYGTDYVFLSNILFPKIFNDCLVHDEFFDKKPFPKSRIGSEFVGDVYDENNIRHPEYYKLIPCLNN